jgi:hypothetical protein
MKKKGEREVGCNGNTMRVYSRKIVIFYSSKFAVLLVNDGEAYSACFC